MNPTHTSEAPLVSIIIPVCNKWDLTQACLRSIEQHTTATPYEIIVMDNGSIDETPRAVSLAFPAVRLIRDNNQIGFSRANNIAVAQARGTILLLLNNDTEVTAGWLEPLVETLMSDTAIAATGPRLLYPDGTVQHAGVIFTYFKSGYHFGAHWDGSHPEVNKRREFKVLTAACLCCRRTDFIDAGGFYENFRNGGEDVDLCLKWWSAGRRMVYDPRSTVIHRESQTPGRFSNAMGNIRLLMKRWRHIVGQDDLALFAQTRMPQPGVRTIPVIINDLHPCGVLQNVLHILLSTSQCAIPILLVTDSPHNRHVRYLQTFAPFISVAQPADLSAVQTWTARWTDDPSFDGILIVKTREVPGLYWDRALSRHASFTAPVVPLISDGPAAQGVLRYAVNLPEKARTSPAYIARYLKMLLPDTVLLSPHALSEYVFLPAAYLKAYGTQLVGIHCCSTATADTGPCAVTPSLLIFHNRSIPALPPVLISFILIATDQNESLSGSIRALQMRTRSMPVEIIVLDNTAAATIAQPLRCVSGITLMHCTTPLNRTTARNRAALAAMGTWLVFADDPGHITTEVLEGITKVRSETLPFAAAMGSPVSCGRIPAIAPVFMVKRSDFCTAGQFDAEYNKHLAEIDLCLRIRNKTGETTRLVIQIPADIPHRGRTDLPLNELTPQDHDTFRKRWPAIPATMFAVRKSASTMENL